MQIMDQVMRGTGFWHEYKRILTGANLFMLIASQQIDTLPGMMIATR